MTEPTCDHRDDYGSTFISSGTLCVLCGATAPEQTVQELATAFADQIAARGFDIGISIWEPTAPTSHTLFDIHRRAAPPVPPTDPILEQIRANLGPGDYSYDSRRRHGGFTVSVNGVQGELREDLWDGIAAACEAVRKSKGTP